MRASSPALLPILRSQVQGEILALLYLHPDDEYTITQVAGLTGASFQSVHHEVTRLVASGLIVDRTLGRARLVRAHTDMLLTRPLTELLTLTYGPVPVLEDELAQVPGIDHAIIYGSWAARHQGETGPPPNDVDLLVVGTAERDELDDAADRAQQVLRREVNVRLVRPEAWARREDPFLREVLSRPQVHLRLQQDSV